MQPLQKTTSEHSLDSLYRLIDNDMRLVDEIILSRLNQHDRLIAEIGRHLISSGGKRIRPAVTLIAAQSCAYKGSEHLRLAAAVELLHSATLLHDDVVDESGMRRGLPTANRKFGNKASILVGDFLLSQAFQLMAGSESTAAIRLLADTSAIIAKGEVLQLEYQGKVAITMEKYQDIIAAKTAALFSCAAELGAVVTEHDEWRKPLNEYGQAIGIAFQLLDDALDYSADYRKLGKNIGDDFREGKITLPTLIAYNEGSAEEKKFWQRTMQENNQQDGDIEQAIAYINKHNAIQRTTEAAAKEVAKAKNSINCLPNSPAKKAMTNLAEFCVNRGY